MAFSMPAQLIGKTGTLFEPLPKPLNITWLGRYYMTLPLEL